MKEDSTNVTAETLELEATSEIETINKMESELAIIQESLANNPDFVKFLSVQKELNAKTAEFWSDIKDKMVRNNVKKIKGDWGWITIGETKSVVVEDEEKLPKKFFKRQIDTELLKNTVKLTGKLPSGTVEKVTYKIMKKINNPTAGVK